ncbi:major facilitator superfamily domain-containing protein, partial [Achaetomium macrosporum]
CSTRIVITVLTLIWFVVVLSTPACRTYADFLGNRFLLGLIDAGVSPIFMLLVRLWYTHAEQVSRSSLWYSFSGGSLLVSPLINYGMGHITGGGMQPWQYMYFIADGHAKGFSEEERALLMERVRGNNAGAENKTSKWYQVRKALTDYGMWGICVLSIVSCTGSGAATVFAPIVFNGMGFSTFESLLLHLPIGALAFICILGAGNLGRFQLPLSNRAGRIVGYYLVNFFSSAWVQCIGLGTSNVAGNTKKAVYSAATFVAYSVGNIIGPLMFDAFTGVLICFVICLFCAEVLRVFLARENKKRDAPYGPPDDAHGLEDLTDRENKSFRYCL